MADTFSYDVFLSHNPKDKPRRAPAGGTAEAGGAGFNMNKPGQKIAMISSTSVDLPEHRPEVRDACLREGFFPDMMESLPARDADAIRVSLEMVDRADVYIGIFAWRYGHNPE